MKIYGVTNSINFGYNKELNDRVNKKLENTKGDKKLAGTLLEMNKFCNETEDKLREAEMNHNGRLVSKYRDMLIPMKTLVANKIDERFPQMDYLDKEIKTYDEELQSKNIKDGKNWLVELVDTLSYYRYKNDEAEAMADEGEDVSAGGKGGIILVMPQMMGGAVGVREAQKDEKTEDNVEDCDVLEKFVPTEYSPKGFESLGGMDEIKEALRDKIIMPLNDPEAARLDEIEYGKKAPRGELFYGPPGCGKTSIMEALSMESGLPMYKLKISKAGSSYINESAKNVQKGYEYAKNVANETGKPVLLAIDEMESMTSKRDSGRSDEEDAKLVSTLLQIIEEARGNNVFILGATNYYDKLDDAIKSRFEDKIYIGLPDDETRKSVLKIHLSRRTKGKPLAENDAELNRVVKMTKGFSNRDISILVDKASMNARADHRRDITADDFIKPIKDSQNMKVKENQYQDRQTRPSVGFNKIV